jgi:hypothetical protein
MSRHPIVDPQAVAFDLDKSEPLAYAHGQYYSLSTKIGKFGFSVEKKPKRGGILKLSRRNPDEKGAAIKVGWYNYHPGH